MGSHGGGTTVTDGSSIVTSNLVLNSPTPKPGDDTSNDSLMKILLICGLTVAFLLLIAVGVYWSLRRANYSSKAYF